ncbi:Uncharacterized protein TCM_038365 [Theobroma cacao]|uniref:Uncharacterized protein n=1 Tax=Theobroma cacao TaxID=3641 RepID=A0A061GPG9_THECC|nr:Uncharacterized protein TCM_038365 [Theobroma cacao]
MHKQNQYSTQQSLHVCPIVMLLRMPPKKTLWPRIIADHYLTIRRWTLGFRSEDASIDSVAAWIPLPGMPLEYYDYDVIARIGNELGRTLKIDQTTYQATRGKFARMCVEIDLKNPFVPKIFIGGRWQKVEYEGLRILCFHCGKFGHNIDCCEQRFKNYRRGPSTKVKVRKQEDTTMARMQSGSRFVVLEHDTDIQDDGEIVPKTLEQPVSDPKAHGFAGRIWIVWNSLDFEIEVMAYSAQLIHLLVNSSNSHKLLSAVLRVRSILGAINEMELEVLTTQFYLKLYTDDGRRNPLPAKLDWSLNDEQRWLPCWPLIDYATEELTEVEAELPIASFCDEYGNWDFGLISQSLPTNIILMIAAAIVDPSNEEKDTCNWTLTSNDDFSIKLAYESQTTYSLQKNNHWEKVWKLSQNAKQQIWSKAKEAWDILGRKVHFMGMEAMITWEKPKENFVKLNIDGSASGRPGLAAAGGLVRDVNGEWLVGFTFNIGISYALSAEPWLSFKDSHFVVTEDLDIFKLKLIPYLPYKVYQNHALP